MNPRTPSGVWEVSERLREQSEQHSLTRGMSATRHGSLPDTSVVRSLFESCSHACRKVNGFMAKCCCFNVRCMVGLDRLSGIFEQAWVAVRESSETVHYIADSTINPETSCHALSTTLFSKSRVERSFESRRLASFARLTVLSIHRAVHIRLTVQGKHLRLLLHPTKRDKANKISNQLDIVTHQTLGARFLGAAILGIFCSSTAVTEHWN